MSRGRWQLGGRQCVIAGVIGVVVLGLGSVSGCIPESKPGFDSPAPSKRLDAIVNASSLEDDESLVRLVEKLRSFDPAERMFAIRSLEIRTGETFGYDHAAHDWQRLEAFGRWIEYLEGQGIETSALTDEGGAGEDAGEDAQKKPMERDAG